MPATARALPAAATVLAAITALSAAGPAAATQPPAGKPPFKPLSGATALPGTAVPLPRALKPHRAALERLLAPAVRLEPGGTPVARLGGAPRLPADVAWPTSPRNPMSFVGELELDALHAAAPGAGPSLPRSGRLALFYDVEESRWGGEQDDAAYFKVLLLREGSPRAAPKGATVFKERRLAARPVRVLPDLEDLPEGLNLGEAGTDAYARLGTALAPEPDHRLGGHPAWIQGDDRPGPDWQLLWQIDSDDAAGFMWGDVGRLYLLIRDVDLAAGRFDRIALVMQCY
jgi:uncharacterized protein YwqG